jgi:hypothetical protein
VELPAAPQASDPTLDMGPRPRALPAPQARAIGSP